MKPRYAVLNEMERDDFEKESHLPYGYGAVDVYDDFEQAMDEAEWMGSGFVVEEVSEDGRQVVHRV